QSSRTPARLCESILTPSVFANVNRLRDAVSRGTSLPTSAMYEIDSPSTNSSFLAYAAQAGGASLRKRSRVASSANVASQTKPERRSSRSTALVSPFTRAPPGKMTWPSILSHVADLTQKQLHASLLEY